MSLFPVCLYCKNTTLVTASGCCEDCYNVKLPWPATVYQLFGVFSAASITQPHKLQHNMILPVFVQYVKGREVEACEFKWRNITNTDMLHDQYAWLSINPSKLIYLKFNKPKLVDGRQYNGGIVYVHDPNLVID